MLRLDHCGASIRDLLIDLDNLSTGRALLSLGCFERIDFRLVALGNFVGLLLQQTDALLRVTRLADHSRALGGFQFLLGVFVIGQGLACSPCHLAISASASL